MNIHYGGKREPLQAFHSCLILSSSYLKYWGDFSETAKVRISLISASLCQAASQRLPEKQAPGTAEGMGGQHMEYSIAFWTQTQDSEAVSYK